MLKDSIADGVFANETLRDQIYYRGASLLNRQAGSGRSMTEKDEDALKYAATKNELASFHVLRATLL